MIFLNDNTILKDSPSVEENILFTPGNWLSELFKKLQRHGKRNRILWPKVNLSDYNGTDNFLVQYRCYWQQDWYTTIHTINTKILDAVRNGQGKMVFVNSVEGQSLDGFLKPMYETLNGLNLPPENIIYITANAIATEEHTKWCDENNIKKRMGVIGIFQAPILIIERQRTGQLYNHTFEQHLNIIKNRKELRHFIKTQRNDRHFKTIPTHHLWTKGLEDTIYTHHSEYARNNVGYPTTRDINTKKWLSNLLQTKEQFEKTFPYIIEDTCKEQVENFNSERNFTRNIYKLSLFNLYPSSWPNFKNSVFLRRGQFHHMWEYQPFIIYGNVNSLKTLKERGYETFSEIFDESYDNVEDDGLRLKMVCEEVERISKLSIEESFDLYESVKDKLIYNRKQLENNIELDRFLELLNEKI
jgi:hypothetical protein